MFHYFTRVMLYYYTALDYTAQTCTELQVSVYTLHPTALTCTAFCAVDCTSLPCNEHAIHCRVMSYTAPYKTDLHCILINCSAAQRSAAQRLLLFLPFLAYIV